MYVNAGELNQRIMILRRPALEADGYLPEAAEPEVVHTCWAKFSQTSGTELAKANADVGEAEILYINTYGDSGEYMELWCRWLSLEGGADDRRQNPRGG